MECDPPYLRLGRDAWKQAESLLDVLNREIDVQWSAGSLGALVTRVVLELPRNLTDRQKRSRVETTGDVEHHLRGKALEIGLGVVASHRDGGGCCALCTRRVAAAGVGGLASRRVLRRGVGVRV